MTAPIEYLAELVEACSHCGLACTGTTLFWHEKDGYRLTVEVDNPTIANLFAALWPVDSYESMPRIFRDSNELVGWRGSDASALCGVAYDAGDLRALVDSLRVKASHVAHAQRALDALSALSDSALAAGVPMFLAEN